MALSINYAYGIQQVCENAGFSDDQICEICFHLSIRIGQERFRAITNVSTVGPPLSRHPGTKSS